MLLLWQRDYCNARIWSHTYSVKIILSHIYHIWKNFLFLQVFSHWQKFSSEGFNAISMLPCMFTDFPQFNTKTTIFSSKRVLIPLEDFPAYTIFNKNGSKRSNLQTKYHEEYHLYFLTVLIKCTKCQSFCTMPLYYHVVGIKLFSMNCIIFLI